MTSKPNGYVLYHGPSELDGKPIVVVATGFARKSQNVKTGDMVQIWIIRSDVAPIEALKTGADASVCGNCPLRPVNFKARANRAPNDKPCYVNVGYAPRAIFNSFHKGIYPAAVPGIFLGKTVRFGAYGDPAAVPSKAFAQARREMVHNTGYTHQWREVAPCNAEFLMASVETPAGREEAKALGYRTFRTKKAGDPVLSGEISCPASKEAGVRTTCENCKLCGGAMVRAKDIVINLH